MNLDYNKVDYSYSVVKIVVDRIEAGYCSIVGQIVVD